MNKSSISSNNNNNTNGNTKRSTSSSTSANSMTMGSSSTSGTSTREPIKLSSQTVAEYQEAFKFFDKDNDGYVDVSEVGRLMRSVGLYPSESEIHQIQKSSSGSRAKVDFAEFLQLATTSLVDANINEQQMREAFRMFDAYGKDSF